MIYQYLITSITNKALRIFTIYDNCGDSGTQCRINNDNIWVKTPDNSKHTEKIVSSRRSDPVEKLQQEV